MEEDKELRFVCKFCNKKYPCGKSLGGHLRSHVIGNSAESDEKLIGRVCKDSTIELIGNSGYGLREKPKKTWRVVDSNAPLQQQQEKVCICRKCGKGFQSLKALCGHMACHSEKERVLKDDQSWSTSQSDTEAEAPPRLPKRAASTRYKRIVIRSSLANSFSSDSEIDQEQEEVAMCLMMLSRDSGKWVGVKSVLDSSDNNSVALETKSSSSIDLRIGGNRSSNFAYNGDEARETKKLGKGKLNSGVLDPQSENSDSGYFMNGPKKVDSDVSVDGLWRNYNFKGQRVDGGSRLEKGLNKVKCLGTELRKCLPEDNGNIESGIASNSMKHGSRKRTINGSYNHGLYGESRKKMLQGNSNVEFCKITPKRSKCDFGSKKKQINPDLSCDGERNLKSKKTKVHKCPICHKVYKSGQALGGHKRSHFLGVSEDRSNQNPVMKEDLSEVPDLLDLNLPAQIDDEE